MSTPACFLSILLCSFIQLYLTTDFYSDFKDDGTNILLDANENAIGPGMDPSAESDGTLTGVIRGLNRYPDPYVFPFNNICLLMISISSDH